MENSDISCFRKIKACCMYKSIGQDASYFIYNIKMKKSYFNNRNKKSAFSFPEKHKYQNTSLNYFKLKNYIPNSKVFHVKNSGNAPIDVVSL